MNSTHAHFNISAREIGAELKAHCGACPPFWILTVEWSGARSCLFWWRHRFQIASKNSGNEYISAFKKNMKCFSFPNENNVNQALKFCYTSRFLTPTNPCHTRQLLIATLCRYTTICNSSCKIPATMLKVFWIAFKNLPHVAATKRCAKSLPVRCVTRRPKIDPCNFTLKVSSKGWWPNESHSVTDNDVIIPTFS